MVPCRAVSVDFVARATHAGSRFACRWAPSMLAVMLLCACAEVSRSPPTFAPQSSFPPIRPAGARAPIVIGVLMAGWHSGLILPIRELGPLGPLLSRSPADRYLSFGWGNRRFYMTSHPSVMKAIRSLFSSASALLIEGAPTSSALVPSGGTYRWLCADRRQVLKVDTFLRDALRQRGGKPVVLRGEPQIDGAFYASGERYDALHTCNTWTAEALEYARLPVHAGGVVFSSQLASQIEKLPACPISAQRN